MGDIHIESKGFRGENPTLDMVFAEVMLECSEYLIQERFLFPYETFLNQISLSFRIMNKEQSINDLTPREEGGGTPKR